MKVAGEAFIAAPADQTSAVLADKLSEIFGGPYRYEPGVIADADGTRSAPLSVLVWKGGQPIGDGSGQAIVPAEEVASILDVTHTLDLDSLVASYARVSAAKAMSKTGPAPGSTTIEGTLGVIFAVDSAVPLEELANELERLNENTHSDFWPDAVAVATKGQVAYMAQMLGDSGEPGLLLPPTPGTAMKMAVPYYAKMMISASGTGTFNLAMHMMLAQLARCSPGYRLDGFETVLEGVPRQGLIQTTYQYNLAGELKPVPRSLIRESAMPPKSVALYPRGGKEQLGDMCFVPWQDGGVVVLKGKLPLEGMLVFLGGIISPEAFKRIQKVKQGDLQISSVLPISERQYELMLRNIQRRGGLDVKPQQGQFVIQKFADEGASSPFMARILYTQMRMAESLGAEREVYSLAHQSLVTTLLEMRDAAKDVAKTWRDYTRKIDKGSIVSRRGQHIEVTESIDRPLGRQVSEFLVTAARAYKVRLQEVTKSLGLDIGFHFANDKNFEKGLAALALIDAPLAAYLSAARVWGDRLIKARIAIEHETWALPRAVISDVGGRVIVTEPEIDGAPVTQLVADFADRILCFVEDVVARAVQKRMSPGLTLTEVSKGNRRAEMPERFQNTITGGGLPVWEIAYHASKFDET